MRCRRVIRLPLVALVVTLCGVGALGGVAWAAFTSSTTATQSLATLLLANPASSTATITTQGPTACTAITVSWPAAANADAYRVQVREDGGGWSDVVTETGAVTSIVDSATHSHVDVEYRVYSRDAGSDWEGTTPAMSNLVTCGVAPVDDLAATNPCSSTTLTWTAPNGANRYDIRRRVNAGTWSTLVTDQVTVGYSDATQHALGAVVEYQVRPGTATVDGNWTASATIASWSPFRVQSIVVANAGAGAVLGTLNAGDTVTVNFSKPIQRASLPAASVRTDKTGGAGGFYPGSAASTTATVGKTAFSAFGTTGTYAGTIAWTNADASWTWTSTVAGSTMTAALANEAFTVGTGVKCAADGATLLSAATQPTSSGRW